MPAWLGLTPPDVLQLPSCSAQYQTKQSAVACHQLTAIQSVLFLVWQAKGRSKKAEHRKGSWEGREWKQANEDQRLSP